MNFRVISVVVGTVSALVLFTAPAYAASNPGNAGSQCLTHSCDAWALTGAIPPGVAVGSGGPPPPPPPCQVAPVGDARAGSQSVIAFYQDSGSVPQPAGQGSPSDSQSASTPAGSALSPQDQQILSRAEQLVNASPVPAGEWYQVVPTTPADQAQCATKPLYIWQPGSGASAILAAGLPLPPGSLAALLYRQLNLPQISKVVLSPQGSSDTNLPTSVQVALAQTAGSPIFLNQQGNPYVVATAATGLGAATVWATVDGLTITPGTGTSNAKTFNDPTHCIEAHPGPDGTFMLGSRLTTAAMAAIGPGQSVDCGVTYYTPGSFNLSVSVNWKACWIAGPPTAGGPPKQGCKPVPGAQALQPSNSGPVQVNVRDIQSVNG